MHFQSVFFFFCNEWSAANFVENMSEEQKSLIQPVENEFLVDESKNVEVRKELLISAILSSIWFVILGGLPFFNNALFGSYLGDRPATAALTPTFIQMVGASVLLIFADCLRRLIAGGHACASWIFDRMFLRKVIYVLVPGLFYGATMALSNTSLQIASVNFHVIIKMTMLVWVIFGSWVFLYEVPSVLSIISCALIMVGATLVSWKSGDSISHATDSPYFAAALALTLFAAFSQALMIISTRYILASPLARRRLAPSHSCQCVPRPFLPHTPHPLEVSALKMLIATCALCPVTLALDPSGWSLLSAPTTPPLTIGLLVAGVFITASFQGSMVAMQAWTRATSTGVGSLLAVVPQVIIALATRNASLDAIHIVGYVLAPLGGILYVVHRVWVQLKKDKSSSRNNTKISINVN